MRSMGSHQSARMASCVWLTPPEIIAPLGSFDLDPCAAPEPRPWPTAAEHIALPRDGLAEVWSGRVWLNPPYGPPTIIGPWLRRMARHGKGTALVFARTETALFFETIWRRATALLFLEGRLHFHYPDGRRAAANSGAPSVLCSYGHEDADVLAECGLAGQFVPLRLKRALVVLALEPTWREAVLAWVRRQRGPIVLADAYRAFARHPKAARNPNYRAKIRQTLQRGPFRQVERGVWESAA